MWPIDAKEVYLHWMLWKGQCSDWESWQQTRPDLELCEGYGYVLEAIDEGWWGTA